MNIASELLKWKGKAEITVKAPGRINLIGEHTDYNLGFVLPAAIDKYIYFAFRKNNSSEEVNLKSLDFCDEYTALLSNIQKSEKTWANYMLGILSQMLNENCLISGFDCVIGGDIPIGSGLSSSAALECGFAFGINKLFGLHYDKMGIAKLGQASENNFLGIKSGILDQFSSVFGKQGHAMKLDCRSMDYEYIPIALKTHSFALINTNVKHSHLTSGYNDRANTCFESVAILNEKIGNIRSLRDVSIEQLNKNKNYLSVIQYKRSNFIINENLRLHSFVKAMENNNVTDMGQLLFETHIGLSQDYEVSCEESDLIVNLSKLEEPVVGARMMGGGFGGCVLLLCRNEGKKDALDRICLKYKTQTEINPEVYHVNLVEGVSLV